MQRLQKLGYLTLLIVTQKKHKFQNNNNNIIVFPKKSTLNEIKIKKKENFN
jgi:hypothetical protein